MLLWSALNDGQTRSYEQAYTALEDILQQKGNEAAGEHFQYPWPEGHESVYLNQ